jgi:hypothetical protein
MDRETSFSSSIPPLSIGNVVSAALRIYRDRFKTYYFLALQAYLWIIVPIYGWAKSASLLGLISRLAFYEVIERPETPADARRFIKPRMWSFLGAFFLFFLIVFAAVFGSSLVLVFAGFAIAYLLENNLFLLYLIIAIGGLTWLFGYLWLISRLFLYQLPLAIEENINASSAIGRSWELSKGYILKIQGIILVAFLVTLPILIVINIVLVLAQILATYIINQIPSLSIILPLIILGINFASNALLVPFWQAIQAILYYDLRIRREGMGINLRDSL